MKRSELFFSAVQVPMDFLMIVLAAITAFLIRDIPQIIILKPKLYHFPFDQYLKIVLLVTPFFLLIYALEGLYDIRATRRFWKEVFKVFSATSIGLVIIIVAIFLKREWFSSRFIILAAWFLTVVYVTLGRWLLQSIQKWFLRRKGIGIHRVLLIGQNGKIKRMAQLIKHQPNLGYKIIAISDNARLKNIKEIKQKKGIDEIILCDSTIPDSDIAKLVDYCAINNIAYRFIPTTLQTTRFEMGVFNGEPIIEIKHTPLDGWGKIIKAVFDWIIASILIIIFSPILLLIALLIKWEDPEGPIIYKNKRIGADGKTIYVYKFRYMQWKYCIDKKNPNFKKALQFEKDLIKKRSVRQGPLYKIKNDPRRMKIGKWIEKFSLDELPQLFNVIRGDMSLVGPRPHQKREVEKYKEYHRRLLTIKPGITGMAQVSGRSDLNFEDEYKLDLYYIENWSLWLDFIILVKTGVVLFKRRKNNS